MRHQVLLREGLQPIVDEVIGEKGLDERRVVLLERADPLLVRLRYGGGVDGSTRCLDPY